MGSIKMRELALSLCILATGRRPFAIVPQAVAKEASEARSIVIGQSFVLDSSVLGEAGEVNAYVPRSCSIGNAKYPMRYLLIESVRWLTRMECGLRRI